MEIRSVCLRLEHRQRRGWSISEMVVVITTMSLLLSSIGGVMFSLARTQHAVRGHTSRVLTVSLLSERFREDAHASSGAELVGGQLTLITVDGTRIRYEAVDGAIHRAAENGDGVHRDPQRKLPA